MKDKIIIYDNDNINLANPCPLCNGTGFLFQDCIECGNTQKIICYDCNGKGYINIITEYNDEDIQIIENAKLTKNWDEIEKEINKKKPIEFEKFIGSKSLAISSIKAVGDSMFLDHALSEWPWAIKESIFKRIIESFFSSLGATPPQEFYSNIIPEMRNQYNIKVEESNNEIEKKSKKTIKKQGPKIDSLLG